MNYREEDIEFAMKILSCRKELKNREVDQWMNVPEHVELLKELVAIREKYSTIDFEKDKFVEYVHLRQVIHRQKKRRAIWYCSIAVSIVFLLGSTFMLLYMNDQHDRNADKSVVQNEPIQPGDAMIELILADGQVVRLSQTGGESERMLEAGIRIDSLCGLSYAQAEIDSNAEEKYNTLNIPKGGFYPLELSDGTKVWLNSETTLRYPVKFTRVQRKVHLKGEAYFEVAADDRHPFIVDAEGMEVKVLGTVFNVNSYNQDTIRTTLVEGRVCVKTALSEGEMMLSPNEMAKYSKKTGTIVKMRVDPFIYTAWKDGKFVFENETIEEIMERLGRWYNVKVFYTNEEAKTKTFTGMIERFSDIRDILHLIEATATVEFKIENHVIIIK